MCLVSIAATALAVIGAHGLWERAPDPRVRSQVVLFNITTALTVTIGIATLYVALFLVIFVAAELIIRSTLLGQRLGHSAGVATTPPWPGLSPPWREHRRPRSGARVAGGRARGSVRLHRRGRGGAPGGTAIDALSLLWLFFILASLQPAVQRQVLAARRRQSLAAAFAQAEGDPDPADPPGGDGFAARDSRSRATSTSTRLCAGGGDAVRALAGLVVEVVPGACASDLPRVDVSPFGERHQRLRSTPASPEA